MMKDTTEFRQRFLRWKNGEQVYDKGRPIPHYRTGLDGEDDTVSSDNTRVVNPRLLTAEKIIDLPTAFELARAKHEAEQIGPTPNISQQERDLGRKKYETQLWVLLKKALELATDEMMKGIIDPRYAALGFGLGQIARAAGSVINAGKNLYKGYKVSRAIKTPQITAENAANMTPTERIFKFLGKEVPEEKATEWVRPEGLSPGKNARWSIRHNIISKHPTILDLKVQGVDVEKLTLDDLRHLTELREKAIKEALNVNNGRYAITDNKSGAKLFGENIDAELKTTKGKSVEPGAIGSLYFEDMPLDKYLEQNWARYGREGTVPIINPELYEGFKVPGMIQNYARDYGVKGVSKDLYSAALFDMMERGTGKGIASGTVLLSPEKTTRVVSPKNFNLVEISPNAGWHQYNLDGTANWQEGPIVGMTGTTSPIQFPVKNKDLFDVNIIDNNGVMHINPKIGSSVRYSWLSPFIGLGTLGTMYGTSNKKQ